MALILYSFWMRIFFVRCSLMVLPSGTVRTRWRQGVRLCGNFSFLPLLCTSIPVMKVLLYARAFAKLALFFVFFFFFFFTFFFFFFFLFVEGFPDEGPGWAVCIFQWSVLD